MLARPAEKIRVGDIVRIMESLYSSEESAEEDSQCHEADEPCIQIVLDSALQAYMDELDKYCLADLARDALVTVGRQASRKQ